MIGVFVGYVLIAVGTYFDAMYKASAWRERGLLEDERSPGEDEVVSVLSGAFWPVWWSITIIDVVRFKIYKIRKWRNDR